MSKVSDNYQTPAYALRPLVKHFKSEWTVVWEPMMGQGNIVISLGLRGFDVIGRDIRCGHDFLTEDPPEKYDAMVSNPPYSQLNEFLKRAYETWETNRKPWALLVPSKTLWTPPRQNLLDKHGFQAILMDKRIKYTHPTKKLSSPPDDTFWLTVGFDLPKQMNFEVLG